MKLNNKYKRNEGWKEWLCHHNANLSEYFTFRKEKNKNEMVLLSLKNPCPVFLLSERCLHHIYHDFCYSRFR